MHNYLKQTPLLNFAHPSIQALISAKGWLQMSKSKALKAIYNFVKDEIKFAYSERDDLCASAVLKDGYGQCNTKGTLLMALLRAVQIPCRLQGFTIDNALKKGVMPNWILKLAPQAIIHSWVEVYSDNTWLELEGYIIDAAYLSVIQQRFSDHHGQFIGYGIATPCLQAPTNAFDGGNTYIQKESIIKSLGLFDCPDAFYPQFSNLTGLKKWLYQWLLRHIINANIDRIRLTTSSHR